MSNDRQFFWHKLRGLFQSIQTWLDNVKIHDIYLAKLITNLIPASCPFEKHVKLWGHTILYIPPLCQLNPFYEQFIGLRFRALCYLAEQESIARFTT
ncbi:MAG: Mo-dependent nitrogenase C-terminal domain-containing protein [Prochloraceae cyanobacterium]|nr:Mo-dependent nitrogenase C-terminal domain-containing protein [Prochloraceae cyanobacterium]